MHVDLDLRILAHEGSGGAGVVEMNMRQKNRTDVGDTNPLSTQFRAKGVETGRRPRVHERHPAGALYRGGGNNFGLPEKIQVGIGDAARNGLHRREILLCRRHRQLDGVVGSIV